MDVLGEKGEKRKKREGVNTTTYLMHLLYRKK